MDNKASDKYRELDNDLRLLFESLKDFTDAQLNRQPEPGQWSIHQHMHHLILSEGLAHKYISKKLSFNPELKNSGISNWTRFILLDLFMRSGIKRKSPEIINTDHLATDTNFWETIKQWKKQRIEFKAYLEGLDPELFKKQLFKHPFAGKLNLNQMLKFFRIHFKRHEKAINKIAKQLPKQIG